MGKTLKRLIGFAALAYLGVVLAMLLVQKSLIYHPGGGVPTPGQSATPEAEIVTFPTADGLELRSWLVAPDYGFPTVVLFHGNAGHVGYQGRLVRPLIDRGYGAFLLEYRGYGGNPGEPGEDGLYADARGGIEFLISAGIPDVDMIFYGRSLGTGVAVQMATEFDPAAIILQAPYTSIPDVGAEQYWFVPVRLLATENFDSLSKIGGVTAPLFMFHGANDTLIPLEQSARLYAAANEPKQRMVIEGAGHNRGVFSNGGTAGVLRFVEWVRRGGGEMPRVAGGSR